MVIPKHVKCKNVVVVRPVTVVIFTDNFVESATYGFFIYELENGKKNDCVNFPNVCNE